MDTSQARTEFLKELFPSFVPQVKSATEATQRFLNVIRESGLIGIVEEDDATPDSKSVGENDGR